MAIKVSIPLMSAATLRGIMSRLGEIAAWRAIRSTAGKKSATTPVELINEPAAATISINDAMSRVSFLPDRRTTKSPIRWAIPVRTSPSPMTKRAPIKTMLGSLKPARASDMVMTPVSGKIVIIMTATASMRGRLTANMTVVAASSKRTMPKCPFTGVTCSVRRQAGRI